ncbi:MAG: hypothetical protein GAK33_01089 [Burkholderia lata]|uniref:Uncharacterized protein n=2 Tax=Burkholderia lata (strain ATCC 17760 / DSM 23089 / LMG 22485 / NCIMB 9086 / R18194 / 383) TaxID=482957 RepID=A0A833UGS6_BURL3|nr:MAG: hypothetical protein GAK33_01089 [Burkholderia lata]
MGEPVRTRSFYKLLTGGLAATISAVSAGAGLWAAWATHESYTSNKLLYRPYAITTQYFDDTSRKYGIYLSNAGIGPAIIKNMTVTVGDRRYTGLGPSIWPQFRADMGVSRTDCFRTGWPLPDSVVKAGEEVPLFTVSGVANLACHEQMLKLLTYNSIVIEIKYASLYGDEFSTTGDMRLNDATASQVTEQLRHYQ